MPERRSGPGGRSGGVLFGYPGAGENPAGWGPGGLIQRPLEILDWLRPRGG